MRKTLNIFVSSFGNVCLNKATIAFNTFYSIFSLKWQACLSSIAHNVPSREENINANQSSLQSNQVTISLSSSQYFN